MDQAAGGDERRTDHSEPVTASEYGAERRKAEKDDASIDEGSAMVMMCAGRGSRTGMNVENLSRKGVWHLIELDDERGGVDRKAESEAERSETERSEAEMRSSDQ